MDRTAAASRLAALRVLLVQIRDQPAVELQERECFVGFSGLAAAQFTFWNVVERPEIRPSDALSYDAVLIGGAGAHSVTESYPFSAPLAAVVERLVSEDRPLFGSCWGHQFVAAVLGGEVITDPERAEVGTFPVRLTDAGAADPWFAGFPERFDVQLGHNDRVARLPPGAVELAWSERQRNQAFGLRDRLVYGAQFHVELDRERMIDRARVYRDIYLNDEGAMERLAAGLRPAPWPPRLLARFLELVARR